MLSIHKTDLCIESYISSTEEEDSVPQRQRFVPEFDVTYLQHTARERSTAAPYLSNHLSIFFLLSSSSLQRAGAYLSCQRDTQSLIYQANLEPVNLTQVLCGEHADTTQLFLTCPILLKCFCALLSSLYSTKHIFLNFLSSSSLLGNHFLNMGLTNQVSYKLTLSLTVKGDLEPGCVAIFTGGKRRSSGWCTVLHVHKTAQTLQQ